MNNENAPAFYNAVGLEIIFKSGAQAEYIVNPFRSNPLSYSKDDSDDRKAHLDAEFSASVLVQAFIKIIGDVITRWNDGASMYDNTPAWKNRLNMIGTLSVLILCDGVGLIILSAALELSRIER